MAPLLEEMASAPCPIYAPQQTWETLENCEGIERRVIPVRTPLEIEGILFEAFPVEHSLRCPAVGYRISKGNTAFFYSPDVVYIPEHHEALSGAKFYIGDGATITRSMVRRRGNKLFGHAPIRTQLTWCQKEGVPRAIFTHCGSEIVEGKAASVEEQVRSLAEERGVEVQVARDGMEIILNS